jgi:hypothetical protein
MVIEITGVTSGLSPYDIFICDQTNTSCFYVSGSTTIPPSVYIYTDNYFPNEQILNVRLIDTNGCVKTYLLVCGSKIFQDDFGFAFMDDDYFVFQ